MGRGQLVFIVTLAAVAACKTQDPLYCDENTPCDDPERPYCDLTGEYPASEGHGRTCIASPFDAGAAVEPDAAAPRKVVSLHVGLGRTCAILDDGALRCWGSGYLGHAEDVGVVGDNEDPADVPDVPTGGAVKSVALGGNFTCLLYEEGNVRCFGNNSSGELGYGHTDDIFEPPSELDDVSLGEPAKQIVAAGSFTCAVLESGAVRCWGRFHLGCSGYGTEEDDVGDDEVPSDEAAIEVGNAVEELSAGGAYVCALLAGGDGRVRCWGFAINGGLGYGEEGEGALDCLGDNEAPSARGDVDTEYPVERISSYGASNCVIYQETHDVSCWGDGVLGHGNDDPESFGDNEPAGAAPNVTLGGTAVELGGGPKCALMSDDSVRCWGTNEFGQLGLGHTETLGDDEDVLESDAIDLGGPVAKLAHGLVERHMCALLVDGTVRCWGLNDGGQLGLGHLENVGDNELPLDVPAVRVVPD